MKNPVYFDYAAATPAAKDVINSIADAMGYFANPSAQYSSARKARELLESSRKDCAKFLQANSEEIIFTSAATESNNLAILGIARSFGEGRVISVASEHSSVVEPLEHLAEEGFEVINCPLDARGKIDIGKFENLLTKNTILVSIAYANGEIGTVQPIGKIGQIIKSYNAQNGSDIKFHADASAAALTLACDVARLGVDALSIGGAKIYGPKGVGLLYLKRGVSIEPLLYGGGQQNSIRPGSESVDLAVGLATALKIIVRERKEDHKKFTVLHRDLVNALDETGINYIYNGHPQERLYQVVNIVLPGQNGEDLVAKLDARGFEVSTGAACEATYEKPSRALLALGLTEQEAQSSLRISFGRTTTTQEVNALAKAIFDIIQPK